MGAKRANVEGKKGWDFAKNILLGSAMGLATGGAIVSFSAVVAGAIGGATATVFGGVLTKQAFAVGALAFDFTAFFAAPLLGIDMEGIEYETPESPYQPPKQSPLPPHPYSQRRHGR